MDGINNMSVLCIGTVAHERQDEDGSILYQIVYDEVGTVYLVFKNFIGGVYCWSLGRKEVLLGRKSTDSNLHAILLETYLIYCIYYP